MKKARSTVEEMGPKDLVLNALTLLHEASSKDDRMLAISHDLLAEAETIYGITEREVLLKVERLDKRRK